MLSVFRHENGQSVTISEQADSYTLTSDDNGSMLVMNKGTAVNVTVPSLLPVGFNCVVYQKGAGQVSFLTSSTTIRNASSHTKTSGQYAQVTLFSPEADVFVLAGDTGA